MPSSVNIHIPRSLWTAKDSKRLAMDTLASIKLRTSKGIDANGEEFKEYSTNPIYIRKRGAGLKPKGGRESRTGESVFYEGGYQQYKQESRERDSSSSVEVDLVLSGNMMNGLVVKSATPKGFIIGLNYQVFYGYEVNEHREFLGLSPDDVKVLTQSVEFEIRKKLLK